MYIKGLLLCMCQDNLWYILHFIKPVPRLAFISAHTSSYAGTYGTLPAHALAVMELVWHARSSYHDTVSDERRV